MKITFPKFILSIVICIASGSLYAQSDLHYTMFLYNKLLYNPGYAGSRDIASVNVCYRNQWTGIEGAPKTFNLTFDAPVGLYMKPFRPVAIGGSIASEQIGVERNTNVMGYYAYRIRQGNTVISMGLRGGFKLYTANYNQLITSHQNDVAFTRDIRNAFLPNAGAGVYVYGTNFYAGFSVPNLFQNYYDKNQSVASIAKEVRGYYGCGGYVHTINDNVKIQPQILLRHAGNSKYRLPFNADFNVSGIFYDRLLTGITYRTDKSFEAIAHIQVSHNINIGYAFDYLVSGLSAYDRGTHEFVVGYDLVRDRSRYVTPRFIRAF